MDWDSIDTLIFDLGGILIDIDYTKTIQEFEKLGVNNFQQQYSQATQSNLFDEFETGKISVQRFINGVLPLLGKGTTANQVVHAWNSMLLDVPLEKIKLLERLKQKYPMFLLSNTNAIHLPIVEKRWAKTSPQPMTSFFEKCYFSHEIQLRKPHAEAFQFVCKENALNPARTLFIDDSMQHVLGAKAFGLQAFHASNSEELFALFS
jgi:putative hydrolase of the HAD superfamily